MDGWLVYSMVNYVVVVGILSVFLTTIVIEIVIMVVPVLSVIYSFL